MGIKMGRNDALRPWLSFVKASKAYGEPSKRAPTRVMHTVYISFMPRRPIILVVTPIAPFQKK